MGEPSTHRRVQRTKAGPKQAADPVHIKANLTHAGRFKHTDRAHMRTESMRANPVNVGMPDTRRQV